MKDMKSALKDAREAIKNKDFQACLRLCKFILKEDKTNYMGLVFLGLSLQEVGPVDQASKAFKKAIQCNPDNPLAWNGLANYYEKLNNISDEDKTELIKAYLKIINVDPNEKKLSEVCEKVLLLCDCGDVTEICKTVYNVTTCEKCSSDTKGVILNNLAKTLEKIKELPSDLTLVYEDTLSSLISNRNTVNSEYYSSYLTLLHKKNKLEELLDHAEKMQSIFETNTIPLLWLCKFFNQFYVEEDDLLQLIENKISNYCFKLLELDQNNAMGLFTKGITLFKEDKVAESRDILVEVTTTRPGLIHAWVFLATIYIKLNLFDDALNASFKAEKLLQSINYSNLILKNKLTILTVEILSKSTHKENWCRALDIYKNIEDIKLKDKCVPYLARTNINLKRFTEAQLLISDLKDKDDLFYKLLSVELLQKQNKYKEALDLLEKYNLDNSESWILMGLLYWNFENYSKCLVPFLKAAKLDSNNYFIFLYLGHCYEKFDDLDKARRCYEKCIKINKHCSEAGTELSKIYRKQKKWDTNLNLLQSLTAGAINRKNCWAWLQLGINYLDQEDYVKAIENLRLVIRVDGDNTHCWESLADAYFARGAYTSALKSYQKASELSENALYPSLQVANIKKILGNYQKAREEFEKILLKNGQYIPALKGLAETCLHQARQCYDEQRLGTARDHAQYALEKITIAILQRSELCCLWKLFADSCFFVARLPEKHSCLLVPKVVVEGKAESGNVILDKDELYSFATRCYCKAVTLLEDNILIWHDLGTCYLHSALNTDDKEKADQLFSYALAAAQHCTVNNPSNWQHWNLLGNVAMSQTKVNYALAQDAFIKAVIADHNSAVSWCNLGILYLLKDDIKLANMAFAQGQRSNPNYVNSWIGQALIAETMGLEDAMDLYRHSTQLGAQQQGALGYGNYVCQTLLDSAPDAVIYSIHNMHAIPVACDALTWYTEKQPYDGCAWNMLGILQERLGLKLSASESFRNAYRATDRDHRDQARINNGRLLAKLGKLTEAIDMFRGVENATFNSGSGLALALFKDQQYEESYSAYESALHWLTENESKQSDLLVALASMAYMFQGVDAAKTLLFQSIQLKPPSPWGLYATLSLGLVHNDIKLAKLVLKELESLKDKKECLQHYALLLSYVYIFQEENTKAFSEVSKLVHRHPDDPYVWLTLSLLLIRLHQYKKPSSASARCAQMAMNLGQSKMDVSKVLCLVSLGSSIGKDEKNSIVSAQKAVHCYPNLPEGWAVLSSVLVKKSKAKAPLYVQEMVKHIKNLNPTTTLLDWSTNQQLLLAK